MSSLLSCIRCNQTSVSTLPVVSASYFCWQIDIQRQEQASTSGLTFMQREEKKQSFAYAHDALTTTPDKFKNLFVS